MGSEMCIRDRLKELLKKTGKDIQLPLIPTDSIVMKVDKEAVHRSGMKIPEALGDSIPEYMTITLRDANGNPKRALYKSELMMLEMLANANWERPIYMAITVGSENHLGMGNHFTQEGLAYRFTPFDTDKLDSKIDSEKMYDNLMNKFKFGGIDKPGIYIDENTMRMCYTHRRIFAQLITQLMKEGKKEEAEVAKARVAEIKESNKTLQADMDQAANDMLNLLYTIPNIPYDSVPEGVGAEDNVVEKMGGMETQLPTDALPHWELAKKYDLIDFDLGVK